MSTIPPSPGSTPSPQILSIWPHRQPGFKSPAAALLISASACRWPISTRNGTLIAQARASSGTSTTLTVPSPQLRDYSPLCPDSALVASTCRSTTKLGTNSWSLAGSTTLTVNDYRPSTWVTSITPNPIDLASPPPSFTIGGTGFTNFGFGLPVANFYRNGTLIAQVRASSGTSTTLTVPFPTTQGLFTTLPGLSVGGVAVQIYNQTGSGSWSLPGSISLTIIQTTPSTSSPRSLQILSILPHHHQASSSAALVLLISVSVCRWPTSIVTALLSLRLVPRQVPAPRLPCPSPQPRDCSPLFPDSALVASQCRSITKLEAAAGVLRGRSH